MISFSVGFTNYTGRRVEVNNGFATIDLHAYDDDIPLEDDATVILSFSSTLPTLVEMVVNNGEFVRDNVTVFIQDNDGKYHHVSGLLVVPCIVVFVKVCFKKKLHMPFLSLYSNY